MENFKGELPREKLRRQGASFLTDAELLALVLGSGIKGRSVFKLAAEVAKVLEKETSLSALEQIHGLAQAKSSLLLAALEYARRRIHPDGTKITQPSDIVPLVKHLLNRHQETLVIVTLNGALEVLSSRVVSVGTLNHCQVHPREVFCEALKERAYAIAIVHNHPSGSLTPSEEDRRITKRLEEAAGILGICMLDHLIVSRGGFYSFKEHKSFVHGAK